MSQILKVAVAKLGNAVQSLVLCKAFSDLYKAPRDFSAWLPPMLQSTGRSNRQLSHLEHERQPWWTQCAAHKFGTGHSMARPLAHLRSELDVVHTLQYSRILNPLPLRATSSRLFRERLQELIICKNIKNWALHLRSGQTHCKEHGRIHEDSDSVSMRFAECDRVDLSRSFQQRF